MKKVIAASVFCGIVFLGFGSRPALAQEETVRLTKDLFMSVGYKLWISGWQSGTQTFPSQQGKNTQAFTATAAASMPSFSLKYKKFFVSTGFLFTPDYDFFKYTDRLSLGTGATTASDFEFTYTGSRKETDFNAGFYVHPAIALTIGYKGVTQDYNLKIRSVDGALVPTSPNSDSKTKYNGVTFGIVGSAPIGGGFSLYGNGVGGFMSVDYEPASSSNNSAVYEASELGLAYKAKNLPLSFSFGYKYQVINNKTDDPNFKDQNVIDLTRGYVLGFNFIF